MIPLNKCGETEMLPIHFCYGSIRYTNNMDVLVASHVGHLA